MTSRRVLICFDSDAAFKPSIKAAQRALTRQLVDRGANPYEVALPSLPGHAKTGADDFLVHHRKHARKAWDALPREPLFVPNTITGTDLLKLKIPPQRWIVVGMFAFPGLIVLGGPPKAGKSWLVLSLVVAVATGTPFLSATVKGAEALYISLEDDNGRLQRRLKQLAAKGVNLDRLAFTTRWPSVEENGVRALDHWLDQHPACRLVVIDTLAKMRTVRDKGDTYLHDSQEMSALKEVAKRHDIALLVVHHLRKAEAADVFERISGSTGITGVADTNAVLLREHNADVGFFAMQGRDLESSEDLALGFDGGVWSLKGRASEYRTGEGQRAVLNVLRKEGPLSAAEVGKRLDKGRGSAFKWLASLVEIGLAQRTKDGQYEAKKI